MPRLFFALWPDPETRNKLALISGKAGLTTGNPVADANLHLTVIFLGVINTDQLKQLITAAASVSTGRFSLVIDRSGWWQQSRIVWLAPRQSPHALLELHASITRLVGDCGISVESRPYSPHITLARNINSDITVQFEPICWNVTEFCLLESIPRSGYAEYKIIQCWPLT